MASESDKLRREARDLIASLRKVTPILLMEAARLVELRAEDQSIAPSHVQGLFEQLRVLGWDGAPQERTCEMTSWDVILRCKNCGQLVHSDPVPTELRAKNLALRLHSSPAFHSAYFHDSGCLGLLEVLALGR